MGQFEAAPLPCNCKKIAEKRSSFDIIKEEWCYNAVKKASSGQALRNIAAWSSATNDLKATILQFYMAYFLEVSWRFPCHVIAKVDKPNYKERGREGDSRSGNGCCEDVQSMDVHEPPESMARWPSG